MNKIKNIKSTKNTEKFPIKIETEKFDFYLYDLPEDTSEANLEMQELKFTISVNIYNDSQSDLLIRIRTNKKDLYTVNPAYSLIERGSFIELKISYLLKSINEDYSKHKFKIETLEIPNLKKVIENTLALSNSITNNSLLRKTSVKKTFLRKSTLFPQVPTESINSVVKAIFEKNEIEKDFQTKAFIKEVNIYYKKSRYQAEKIKNISKTNSSNNLIKAFPFALKGKSSANIYSAFAAKNISSNNLNNLRVKFESPTKKSLYIDFNTRKSSASEKFITINELKLNYYSTEVQISKEEEDIFFIKERLNYLENQLKLISTPNSNLDSDVIYEFNIESSIFYKKNKIIICFLYFLIFLLGIIVGNSYI